MLETVYYKSCRMFIMIILPLIIAMCTPPAKVIASDPTQDADVIGVLELELKDRDDIREVDKSALRAIIETLESIPEGLGYSQMTQNRQQKICQQIKRVIKNFPIGEFDTPLQRRAKSESFRMNSRVLYKMPVFAPQQSTEMDKQLETITDLLISKADRTCPEIADSVVEREVRRLILSRFHSEQQSDMTPTFKVPLPTDEFAAFTTSLEQMNPLDLKILGKDGRLIPNWDEMDSATRTNYLKDNAIHLTSDIFNLLQKSILSIQSTYEKYALDNVFPDFDPAVTLGVSSEEQVAFSELQASARAERQAISKESAAKQAVEDKKKRVSGKIMTELALSSKELERILQPQPMMLPEDKGNVELKSQPQKEDGKVKEIILPSPPLTQQGTVTILHDKHSTDIRLIIIGLLCVILIATVLGLALIKFSKRNVSKN